MAENSTKRSFPADIFAEDNDKWSWSAPSANTKTPLGVPNYAALRKATKDEASSSSGSENESAFRSDSNSVKRIFRKRSSSNSEGNPLEDASSSPNQSTVSRERLLPPSMYDDDARSASPSAYEKKDLAFAALFQKDFHPIASRDGSPPFEGKSDKPRAPEKEMVRKYNKGLSPTENSPKRPKAETSKPKDQRSRTRSRDRTNSRRSRSRSKGRRTKSPVRDRKRRSRSRDRHSDRDRRHHSKSRSRRSHSRDSRSKKSPSREPKSRRSPSRDSRRKSRSRSRERKRSRSRGYRRSRSRSYDRNNRSRRRSSSRDKYRRKNYSRSRSRSRDRSKGRSGGAMTPQMALQQTMAAMNAKAQALTGIALPKYYNPAAVNPLKYAEQVQKRKLLWQTADKVEEQPKSSVWDKLTFAQDQDGKMTAKFRKLMGIKSENPIPPEEEKESVLKKQEELFRDLDQQYEMARMTTHTQRGVGLGYSAQTLYPPIPK